MFNLFIGSTVLKVFFSQVCTRTGGCKQPAAPSLSSHRLINYSACYCIKYITSLMRETFLFHHSHPLLTLSRGMWGCFATINSGITFCKVIFTLRQIAVAPLLPSSHPSPFSLPLPLSLSPQWLHPAADKKLSPQGVHVLWAHLLEFSLRGCLLFCLRVWFFSSKVIYKGKELLKFCILSFKYFFFFLFVFLFIACFFNNTRNDIHFKVSTSVCDFFKACFY